MMKKTLIATSLIALMGVSVAMAGHGFGGNKLERMKSMLNLSETQAAQVEVIMQEQKAQMQALRDATEQRIQTLLTPDQATKFAEMKQKREERKQKRMERRQQYQGG